jgi:hypothetical protein
VLTTGGFRVRCTSVRANAALIPTIMARRRRTGSPAGMGRCGDSHSAQPEAARGRSWACAGPRARRIWARLPDCQHGRGTCLDEPAVAAVAVLMHASDLDRDANYFDLRLSLNRCRAVVRRKLPVASTRRFANSRLLPSQTAPMNTAHKRYTPNRLARQIARRTPATAQIAPSSLHVLQSGA